MKQVEVVLLLLGSMGTAGAALLPAVNGQVYDDVLEISWLEDANFVKTSCDENNALWQAFDPTTITGNSGRTKTQICEQNVGLNWNEAEGWIAVLNANNHLGHSDSAEAGTDSSSSATAGVKNKAVPVSAHRKTFIVRSSYIGQRWN